MEIIAVEEQEPLPEPTISDSKVVDIETALEEEENPSGYRLIDISILGEVFRSLACPECCATNSLHLYDINKKKKGLARSLVIKCITCPYEKQFWTSKDVDHTPESNKGGGKFMEVNVRAVYGMRAVGLGHTPLKKLCCYMNMPEPMHPTSYEHA